MEIDLRYLCYGLESVMLKQTDIIDHNTIRYDNHMITFQVDRMIIDGTRYKYRKHIKGVIDVMLKAGLFSRLQSIQERGIIFFYNHKPQYRKYPWEDKRQYRDFCSEFWERKESGGNTTISAVNVKPVKKNGKSYTARISDRPCRPNKGYFSTN